MANKKCLYIHIRDLRYTDNLTYNKVLEKCKDSEIVKVFFYNKEQITNKNYASNSAITFFMKRVKELKIKTIDALDLNDITIQIDALNKKYNFKYIAYHYDYTKYAIKRQSLIETYAKNNNIELINTHDQLLLNGFHLKENKETYFKFTPYYKSYPIKKVSTSQKNNVIMNNYSFDYLNYSTNRNKLNIKTSELSKYLKYGIISPREAYHFFKLNEEMVKQLIWRDFY